MSEAGQLFTDGKAYERLMGRWSRLVGEQFLDWLAIPNGLRWLDVGCGNGAFTEVMIARSAPASVVAVDPSEGQLAYARTRAEAKLAEFKVADAQALPFTNDSFDVAEMALVISFVPDAAKAVAEMARVVRPGGWVATYMWDILGGGLPLHPYNAALESLGMGPPARPNVAASQLSALRTFWEDAKLDAIETRVIRINVKYRDFDDFWESTTVPVGPHGKFIADLSPDVREKLRLRLREQLPAAPDGSISYEAFANAVKGRVPG
jgi:SAM-dependent methyltransferase